MTSHVIYLAVIIVLVLVIVVVGAKAYRTKNALADVRLQYGLSSSVPAGTPRDALRATDPAALAARQDYESHRADADRIVERALELDDFPATEFASPRAALMQGDRRAAVIVLEFARTLNGLRAEDEDDWAVDPVDAAFAAECLSCAMRPNADPALSGPDPALIAAAIGGICRQVDWIRKHCPETKNVDRAATHVMNDIAEASKPEPRDPVPGGPSNHRAAAVYGAVFAIGWAMGGGDIDRLSSVRKAGRHFGIACETARGLAEFRAGPGLGYHRSFASMFGAEAAAEEVRQNSNACHLRLQRLGMWTPTWVRLSGFAKNVSAAREGPAAPDIPAAPPPDISARPPVIPACPPGVSPEPPPACDTTPESTAAVVPPHAPAPKPTAEPGPRAGDDGAGRPLSGDSR